MEFLGIGPLELIFVLVIALIIIGPKDMGKTARRIGHFLNRLYKSEGWRTFLQASRNLRTLPSRLAREAELEELRQVGKAVKEVGEEVSNDLRAAERDLKARSLETVRELRAMGGEPEDSRRPEAPTAETASEPPTGNTAQD